MPASHPQRQSDIAPPPIGLLYKAHALRHAGHESPHRRRAIGQALCLEVYINVSEEAGEREGAELGIIGFDDAALVLVDFQHFDGMRVAPFEVLATGAPQYLWSLEYPMWPSM